MKPPGAGLELPPRGPASVPNPGAPSLAGAARLPGRAAGARCRRPSGRAAPATGPPGARAAAAPLRDFRWRPRPGPGQAS